jgi:hypothetical protein
MGLQDPELFDYSVYPLLAPNLSNPGFTDLPTWQTVNLRGTFTPDQQETFGPIAYFANTLMTSLDDIPINAIYAYAVDSLGDATYGFGYPSSKYFLQCGYYRYHYPKCRKVLNCDTLVQCYSRLKIRKNIWIPIIQ